MSDIEHGKTCSECNQQTFAYERYCHKCNHDMWADGT